MKVINIAFSNIYRSFRHWAHSCVHLLGVWWRQTPTTNDCQYTYLSMGFHVVWLDCWFCQLAHRINPQQQLFVPSFNRWDRWPSTNWDCWKHFLFLNVFSKEVGRRARAAVRGSGTSVDGLINQVRLSFIGVDFLKLYTFWLESVRFETTASISRYLSLDATIALQNIESLLY